MADPQLGHAVARWLAVRDVWHGAIPIWAGLICAGLICAGLICAGLICAGLICAGEQPR
jgi:hypothetical protein